MTWSFYQLHLSCNSGSKQSLRQINICYLPAGRSVWWKTVTEVLKILPEAVGTFQLSGYFLWTIKINCRRFLGRLSTNVMTLLFIQIHSETNIFLSTKVIWEREKRGFISYLSAWGSDRRVCLEILPSRKNEIYLWKMATKVGMYSATHESVTFALGQR